MSSAAAAAIGGALIASPNRRVREQVRQRLNALGCAVQHASGGADALAKLESGQWKALYLDRHLPDLDAEELAAMIRTRYPRIQVTVIDGEAELPEEPIGVAAGSRIRDQRSTERIASDGAIGSEPLPGMIGSSEAMQRVYRLARLVAGRTTTVLIAGPTGSGKELVARAIHSLSPRGGRPLVVVNCAAIPEALLESELFGYSRGAFTGAVQAQAGRIAAAHGGSLLLDEVGELPLGMQAKLLRFLEQKEIQRLGSSDSARVDVRVLAASNVDLTRRVSQGQFREDLFFRLSAFPILLPPLAARRDDIVPLAEHFLACMSAAMNVRCPHLSADSCRMLEQHPWRGNVRELQHVMERASILAGSSQRILPEHLYFPSFSGLSTASPEALRSSV